MTRQHRNIADQSDLSGAAMNGSIRRFGKFGPAAGGLVVLLLAIGARTG